MKTITIISLRGPTNKGVRGGAREYIQEVFSPFVKNGVNVNVVCGAEPSLELYDSETVHGINVIRVGKEKREISKIIKYYKENLEIETDILIENVVSFPMFIPLIRKGKPCYAIFHHLTGWEYFRCHNFKTALIGIVLEKIGLRIGYKKVKNIAVSNHTRLDLIANGLRSKNVRIVNPGYKSEFFNLGMKSDYPTVVFIGRYEPYGGNKRVDHLVSAFEKVSESIPNARLIIAGRCNGEIVIPTNLENNISVMGEITDLEKKELMQKAWVFASPSLAEGFGITWIEANACGTVVLGYRIEDLNTVTKESGVMVEMGNVDQLTENLLRLLSDKQECTRRGAFGVENSKKYSWNKSYVSMEQLIRDSKYV